jgi:hypothetical protein
LAWLAIGGAASAGANALSQNAQGKRQEQLTREGIASDEAMHRQNLALQESQLNPFRQQAFQASTAAGLDELERGAYTPVQLARPGGAAARYASAIPEMSGGYSYQKSPELTQAAGLLKRDVLAGHAAPSALNLNPVPASFQGRGVVNSPQSERLAIMDLLRLIYGEDAPYPSGTASLPRGPGPTGARRAGARGVREAY